MTLRELLMVLGMMAVTFGVRYPVLAMVGRLEMPPRVQAALRFVPPAVLSAIVAPAVFAPQGALWLSFTNSYLVAGAAAALIAWRTRNLLWTLVLGMVTFWVWRWLI